MIVITGDSHATRMREALSLLSETEQKDFKVKFGKLASAMLMPGRFFNKKFFREDNEGIVFTDEEASRIFNKITKNKGTIKRNDPRKFLFSMGFHAVTFLNNKCWSDFSIDPKSNKQYISKNAFIEMVKYNSRYTLKFLEKTKSLGVEFSVLMSPPPQRSFYLDRDKINKNFTESQYLLICETYRNTFANELNTLAIDIISPPDEAIKDGFLREEFASEKPGDFHSNIEFKMLYLKKLLTI
ncbi:MAG: hypothetical protein C0618_00795 [Desulfuromonas sp.]|nr:MAG: hypothetical protein C0618_00795 [Desulfuromonas sp.]